MLCSENLTRRIEVRTDDIRRQMLDEAFVGKEPVSKIQRAMDKLYQYYKSTRNPNLNRSAENRELQKAIVDVFGFKYADVFWSVNSSLESGPYTYPSVVLFHASANKSFSYGKNQNGFYDSKHELHAIIHMNTSMFDEADVTSAEAVAILLHEIGHNFDFSPFAICNAWYNMIISYFTIVLAYPIQEWGSGILMRLTNLDTFFSDLIPPIRPIFKAIHMIVGRVAQLGSAIVSPLTLIYTIPNVAVMTPLNYIANIFTRKSERFADSFAATYGYAPELSSGLEKIIGDSVGTTSGIYNIPVIQTLYDLASLNNEILTMCMGGHQTNQQRMIKMMSKLNDDLNSRDVSPAMKKEIRKNLVECEKVYKALMNLDDEQRNTMVHDFRRMVDDWYAGKDHIFIPSIGYDTAE